MMCRTNFVLAVVLIGICATVARGAGEKVVWKPVQFAIVRYNDDAPASWNMYHGEKKGVLLLRLWRRYLLVNTQEQEVYELDPDKIKAQGDNVEWSPSDVPADPIETSEVESPRHRPHAPRKVSLRNQREFSGYSAAAAGERKACVLKHESWEGEKRSR